MHAVRASWLAYAFAASAGMLGLPGEARAAADVSFDKDFLAGVVEKVPPVPFHKDGQYRGVVRSFRLAGIDPKTRRFLVFCQVVGEFRAPVAAALKPKGPGGSEPTDHWKSFTFDVRAGVNIEPGRDGTPRFKVEIEEVKRRELEGIAGALAKVLGKSFDQIVTQVVDGKASQLGEKLNAELQKRVKSFRDYGVLCAIDYAPGKVVLHFDVTRLKAEGVVGYVYTEPKPGTVPLTRWVHPKLRHYLYTITPYGLEKRGYLAQGISCYVFPQQTADTVPLYRWRSPREPFYTTSPNGEGVGRSGFRLEGIACALYPESKPDTVPLYRFVDPRNGRHFYTVHKYAEFMK